MPETNTEISRDLQPARCRNHPDTRFSRIIEATTDVVAMTDRTGRLSYLNTAGRRLLSLPEKGPLPPRTLRDLHPAWAYEILLEEGLPTALSAGSWSGESALVSSEGGECPVLQVVLAHSGEDDDIEFISTICRDISERKQEDLERIEWANRYNAAIRASGQVVFDWDTISGAVTYGGEVEKLLGCHVDVMRGGIDRLREMVHPEDLAGFDGQFESARIMREPFEHSFRITRRDGIEAFIHAHGCFFLDRKGHIGRMVGFLMDVTKERTAERAIQLTNEHLEEKVLERTSELARANTELKNSAMRQAAVVRLGQRALAGQPLGELMTDAAKAVQEMLPADRTSVMDYDESRSVFKVIAEVGCASRQSSGPVSDGKRSQCGYTVLIGEPVVSHDLTKETRFESSLSVRSGGFKSGLSVCIKTGDRPLGVIAAFSLQNREFSRDDVSFVQSIGNVITAAIDRHHAEENIRRAKADAESANRAKSEFLSRMSHELRTPLNAILGFTQLLEMEEHTAKQGESIIHISRAGRNLLELINEVLDIARLEAGRIQFNMESVDVGELLQEAVNFSRPAASKRKVTIRIASFAGSTPFVSSDRERLKQVFLNLLSNAVKFNQEGGSITLAVARMNAATWRISVTDTGAGIPQEKLDRLFVPFERLGTREGGTEGGTGLGLTLCQRLVSGLGGRIGVASSVGLGSTFWVELPATDPPKTPPAFEVPQPPEQSAATSPVANAVRKILYIEDDAANYYLLERFLRPNKDIKLLSAVQGSIGLDLAREHLPDLILLDLNLPDMTGEQVLRELRKNTATAATKVVAVTGEVVNDREAELKALGVSETLVKPYKLTDITALLARTLTAK